jgi:hypothetical protein
MYIMMIDMTKQGRPIPGVAVPPLRTVQIGFRICPEDARLLTKLARAASVGHLTLARLVLEAYLDDIRGEKPKGVTVKKGAT